MDKTKSAVDMFLEGTENEQNNPFNNESKDPFSQSEEVVEEVKEEKLPFHKDPKIQKFIEKELQRQLKDLKPEVKEEKSQVDEFKSVLSSMEKAIGNDTPEKVEALNAYRDALLTLDKRATERAREALNDIKEEESRADREAEEELKTAFENIEDNYDVDFSKNPKLRSEFATFVERISPKDSDGEITNYPDMYAAWETFSETRKSQPSRAKDLASRGMARSQGTETAPSRRINFEMVNDMFDKMT